MGDLMSYETRRLLNMRERAAVRAAHQFSHATVTDDVHGTVHEHIAACDCGEFTATSAHAYKVTEACRAHLEAEMSKAAGRKCAIARANAAAELEARIEAQLAAGLE